MKGVVFYVLSLIVASCGYHEDAETNFASRDLLPQPPQPAADTAVKSHYYAKYRFTADGKYDVDAALRVGVGDDGRVIRIEVKDISPGREDSETELLTEFNWLGTQGRGAVFSEGQTKVHANRIENGFSAKVAGQGNTYYGWASRPKGRSSGIKATDDGWSCCGKMHFVDNPQNISIFPNTSLVTFVGTKVDLEGLDELWWKEINGICEHRIEFVDTASKVSLNETYTITARILDCTNKIALLHKARAYVSRRFKDHGIFYEAANNEKISFERGVATFSRKIKPGLYKLLKEQGYGNVVQYKITTTVDGKKVEGMTSTIKINPQN